MNPIKVGSELNELNDCMEFASWNIEQWALEEQEGGEARSVEVDAECHCDAE